MGSLQFACNWTMLYLFVGTEEEVLGASASPAECDNGDRSWGANTNQTIIIFTLQELNFSLQSSVFFDRHCVTSTKSWRDWSDALVRPRLRRRRNTSTLHLRNLRSNSTRWVMRSCEIHSIQFVFYKCIVSNEAEFLCNLTLFNLDGCGERYRRYLDGIAGKASRGNSQSRRLQSTGCKTFRHSSIT